MSIGEIAILGLIIAEFASFAGVLAWASSEDGHRDKRMAGARPRHDTASPAADRSYALYD